jgi:hypothetical protein
LISTSAKIPTLLLRLHCLLCEHRTFWDGFLWCWGRLGVEWYRPHIKGKCVILICLLFPYVVGIEEEKRERMDGWMGYLCYVFDSILIAQHCIAWSRV